MIAGLIPTNHLVLVPVPMLSVSVRGRGRARVWSVSGGSAGFLASGLLLRSTLDSFISLRRTDRPLTRVSSAVVVLSGSISVLSV